MSLKDLLRSTSLLPCSRSGTSRIDLVSPGSIPLNSTRSRWVWSRNGFQTHSVGSRHKPFSFRPAFLLLGLFSPARPPRRPAITVKGPSSVLVAGGERAKVAELRLRLFGAVSLLLASSEASMVCFTDVPYLVPYPGEVTGNFPRTIESTTPTVLLNAGCARPVLVYCVLQGGTTRTRITTPSPT